MYFQWLSLCYRFPDQSELALTIARCPSVNIALLRMPHGMHLAQYTATHTDSDTWQSLGVWSTLAGTPHSRMSQCWRSDHFFLALSCTPSTRDSFDSTAGAGIAFPFSYSWITCSKEYIHQESIITCTITTAQGLCQSQTDLCAQPSQCEQQMGQM